MNQKCPLCSNNKVILQDKKLSVFYCNSCNHRFTLLEKKEQEKYTPKYFSDTHKNWFGYPNYRLFSYVLRKLPRRKIKLLDVGCGNGSFLKYVLGKKNNIELHGIDLVENNYPDINFIKADISKVSINEKFDVIVSFQTIEHIDNPHRFIKILKNMLKDNGIIFIDTINSGSLMNIMSEHIKKLWRVPYERVYDHHHLNHFSKQSLRKLMKTEKFEVIEQISHNYPFKAIDVPKGSFMAQIFYKAIAILIFILSSLINKQFHQIIVCVKK